MNGSQYENIIDLRLRVLLLVACCIVVLDYCPVFEKNDNTTASMQLYAEKDGQLGAFFSGRPGIDYSLNDMPVTLAPFFFKPLNINSADKATLMIVKGVGPNLSENIIRYRNLHGSFKSIDDLLRLKGVGPKRAEYFTKVFSFGEQY